MDLPKRKPNRLPSYDYSQAGAYFITICTQDQKNLLANIVGGVPNPPCVGGGVLDAPHVELTSLGQLVEKVILSGNQAEGIRIDKFVIMPNHIHLILIVDGDYETRSKPNARIPHYVSTLKRFCYKDAGVKFFQRSYHDHVIRNEQDYLRIWQYIDTTLPLGSWTVFTKNDFRGVEDAAPYEGDFT